MLRTDSNSKSLLIELTGLKFKLDEASNLLGSDNLLVKERIDGLVNETTLFFDYLTSKGTSVGEYMVLVLIFIFGVVILLFIKRRNVKILLDKIRNKTRLI